MNDLEGMIRHAKRAAPDWHPLRARRIWMRVKTQMVDSVRPPRTRLNSRALTIAVTLTMLTAIALGVWRWRQGSMYAPAAQLVTLLDGSTLSWSSGPAPFAIHHASHSSVHVRQRVGAVTYRVAPKPRRRFRVEAGNVNVRVLGTEFTVTRTRNLVRVEVVTGQVLVDDGTRRTTLRAQEALQVTSTRSVGRAPDEEKDSVRQLQENRDGGQTNGGSSRSPMSAHALREHRSSAERETALRVDGGAGSRDASVKDASDTLDDISAEAKESQADDIEAHLLAVDAARAAGNLALAKRKLTTIIARYPGDPRVVSALFLLGRVERARGHHMAAARAFERCASRQPSGTLGADALSEAVASWQAAGKPAMTAELARDYLRQYPRGRHAEQMRRIVSKQAP